MRGFRNRGPRARGIREVLNGAQLAAVPMIADGILRRLAQSKALRNAAVRTIRMRNHRIVFSVPNGILDWTAREAEKHEPETLDWIDGFQDGSVFYDLGASNGIYSLYAAAQGAWVAAFEPDLLNLANLSMNHSLNRDLVDGRVHPINAALSDTEELGALHCRIYEAGRHVKILDQPRRVTDQDHFDAHHVQPVVKVPLDDLRKRLGLPIPRYVKIDVDGSEEQVLRGAAETLSAAEVESVLMEVAYPDSRGRSDCELLCSMGYQESARFQVRSHPNLYNMIFSRT